MSKRSLLSDTDKVKKLAVGDRKFPAGVMALERAFERFNSLSGRLEQKYQELQAEAMELRVALGKKEAELKRSERLATLGETAAALAHEVRNPLGAMRLMVSLLRDDLVDRPASRALVEQLDKSISALDLVVSNMLQFARNSHMHLAPLDLHRLIADFIMSVESSFGAVQVRSVLDAESPLVLGNESGLRQVLQNLLSNALHALGKAGLVEIRTRRREDGRLELSVQDSGPGIPDEILADVFEPFVTGRHEGTGLGLAVVRKIVEQHGASITARNEGGACFTICFPRKASS